MTRAAIRAARENRKLAYAESEKYLKIPQTHRISGWSKLAEFTGYPRDRLNRWIKLEGLAPPLYYWVKTENKQVWRKLPIWDKRHIGDWFKTKGL